ncbi:cilia- and flagella-associated protein 91-like isoform X2 [Anthonomus grandis grandis]|uniref:cilia- and flagella-associated protein 91-like isoform X2 n=1 Tax=Anthonomus grandis grandis TaxID=2921223 RepID=UPI0021666681|nr:cilia- and flagella-associated protein 91-like isoform X2 [Anthonomus grandis grandis]
MTQTHIDIFFCARSIFKMITKGCIPYRPHDYMYDPIFTVSGPVDHYKAAIIAKMSSVKFQICPIFANMFSDLPNHPRVQMVQRRQKPVMSYREKIEGSKYKGYQKQVDVGGADRAKFFCPIINLPPKDFLGIMATAPRFTIEKLKTAYDDSKQTVMQDGKPKTKNFQMQTIYRDSCAQTTPWQPPYKVIGKGDPEILKLEFLKWGSGLPAGVHEVRLIERARMKRAWENSVKPDINDEDSLQRFRDYVEALERDEWAFREREIQEIHDLRLHLLEKMLEDIHERSHTRAEQKMERFIKAKEKEKKEKLEKIKKETARELRKLNLEEKGYKRKYHQADIIEEHMSRSSELFGPMLRNGEHPKRWHQIIDEKMQRYKAQFIGVEHFSTLPRWLDQATNLKGIERKKKDDGPQLCIRETKWTAPVLKELHEELMNLRGEPEKKSCSLRVKNTDIERESYTPEVEGIPAEQEEQYQAVIYLQSIIEGRARQMLVYEGRDNCKELIRELKFSVGLLKKQKELRSKEKLKVRAQQREETIQSVMVSRLQGTLGTLQGQVVGSILDFLNKELRRLLEERKAHAMCWVNERERNIREAAEAGRRQKEIRRRREHDEIFRQIVKVTQESVDVYLQDVITEGLSFATQEEARAYILALADKLEKEVSQIDETYSMKGIDSEDELIADLVHHFVLPEVEKQEIRQKILARQKQKLKTIHENVYRKLETVPKFGKKRSSIESSSPTIEHYQNKMDEMMLEGVLEKIYTPTEYTPYSIIPVVGTAEFAPNGVQASIESPSATLLSKVGQPEVAEDPHILEHYLNMLAAQDDSGQREMTDHPFQIRERVPEINRVIPNYQPFNNDLDTIPETEHETSTSVTTNTGSQDLNLDGMESEGI